MELHFQDLESGILASFAVIRNLIETHLLFSYVLSVLHQMFS